MKFSLITAAAFGATVNAHCQIQQLKVNGNTQPSLAALRVPSTNNPVYDVTTQDIVCGASGTVSSAVVNAQPGDQISAWAQHVIGGPQFTGDLDNPIAASHKGPVSAWLAKLPSGSSAATASAAGLQWFKIWEDNLNTTSGKWGVDNLIANSGWVNFALPTCVAPGQYLLRVNVLALHSAYASKGAQFYTSCGQLLIGGSGTLAPATVSLPGAFAQNDPSVQIQIYGATGKPDNGGKAYVGPGPAPITC